MRWSLVCAWVLVGCGGAGEGSPTEGATSPPATAAPGPFAGSVVDFAPGEGAGFGQDLFPDVVLGAPEGGGERQGSVDVLSLGAGGVIVLELAVEAVDGEGVDLLVFENAFWTTSDPESAFAEPGEVAASLDGQSWLTWGCEPAAYPWEGCAGKTPVYSSSSSGIDPTDPERAGGDGFDLAALGLQRARYVRVTDRTSGGAAPSAGFDLDAISVVHPSSD